MARWCRAISGDLEVSITRSGRVIAVGKMLEWCFLLKAMFKRRDALPNILEIKIELGELNIPGAGSHGAGP